MADVKDQLTRLIRIQELVLESQEAQAVIDAAPGRIEDAEARFRERNAEYVAIKERFDALDADRKTRSEELLVLEESRKKYMDSLMQVKNQREYAAALKEIDTVKARIAENEDVILKAMEETETLQGEIQSRAEHIEAERALVDKEHADVEREMAGARETIARCSAERAEIEKGLPSSLVLAVRRVEEGRRGLFLVKASDAMCSACHVRVRPQVYQEIRLGTRLHTCSSCKRFLYHENSRGDSAETASPSSGVRAMNGGPA